MFKKFSVIIFLIAICNNAFAQRLYLQPVPILDGKVTLQLPGTVPAFEQNASRLLWKTPYPVTGVSFINGGETFLEFAYTEKTVDDNGIPAFTDELLATFPEKKNFTKHVEDGIYLKDGKNIGYLKLVLKEKGDHSFHYFFYLSVNERLLLFHFATTAKLQKKWEPVIDASAKSIALQNPFL